METINILLVVIASASAVGFIFTRKALKSSEELNDRCITAAETANAKLEELREKGVSLPPNCEHCGDITISHDLYEELLTNAAAGHAFSCPRTIASVPQYSATIRKEKGDKEELRRVPVETVLESHKLIAEEARKYGVKSMGELKAAKRAEAKKTGTN